MRTYVPASIQVEFVSEVATEVETLEEAHLAPAFSIQLVDKRKFLERLISKLGLISIDDIEFWDNLFGNIPYMEDQPLTLNPHVRYLTTDSCEKILKHRLQFRSGIDFQHLPPGFLLVKNPRGGGVCDVLHYSEYYAQFQAKDDNHVFALTLLPQEELNAAPVEESSFSGPQAAWYAFLQHQRVTPSGVYCSESQLKDAFIRFSTIIQEKGLHYYLPEFPEEPSASVNPLVLLGRWETVLSNPRLQRQDLTKQWEVLLQLPLMKSCEAIRAITDYAQDVRACGFVLPEMKLDKDGFSDKGFRPRDDVKTIVGHNMSSFWRFIAYQPQRYSIGFYEKALERLSKIDLHPRTRQQMLQILVASTVGYNHEKDQEEAAFIAFNTLCDAIEKGPFGIRTQEYTDGVVSRLYELPTQPNIAYLQSIAQHIKENLFHPQYLVILSNRLSLMVTNLKDSLYHGAKFYFTNGQWRQLSINLYLNLQYDFYRYVGGAHAVEATEHVFLSPDSVLSPKLTLLAPHLSTFNLLSMKDIQQALATWPLQLSPENQARLHFCFELFNDVQTNDGLTATTVAQLIDDVTTMDMLESSHWRLELLDYLKQFASRFRAGYFEHKEKQLRDAVFGLTPEQISKVRACGFAEAANIAIISLQSAIVEQEPEMDAYLAALNDQLMILKQMITPDDFILFTQQLDEMRVAVASDYRALPGLIDEIIKKRSLEGFNQIFVRNEIEKSKDHVLPKFSVFIDKIKPLVTLEGLGLDKVMLQETLATLVLNSPLEALSATDDYQQKIMKLITQLNHAATVHPQIKYYVLACLNHMPNPNTRAYLEQFRLFGKNLKKLCQILPSGEDEFLKENMFVIYSLFAHYHQRPVELTQLIEQVVRMPPAEQAFMLRFLSRLLDNKQSITSVETLIDLLIANQEKLTLFKTMGKTPPYPNVETLVDWLQTAGFAEQYARFSINPYGDRRLDYAFNVVQYQKQRGKFVGVDAIFTDDIGRQLAVQLSENRGKTIQVLMDEYQTICARTMSDADKLQLLCICVEMLARTASQKAHDDKRTISQELNTTQIMAVYAKIMNPSHRLISQIDTGEGKSRIMMVLAACQAAQGRTVDFLTSDMQLAERDYLSYRQFFTALGIPTSLISLNTPSQLYQRGGVNFTDNSQLLLLRNRSDIEQRPYAYLDERKEMRCLLVDEVDKFIHDKSKDAYNYASQSKLLADFVFVYPALMQYMDSLSLSKDASFDPAKHLDTFLEYIQQNVVNRMHKASLTQLSTENPQQILTWLRSAHTALHMEADKHYIMTEPDKDKLYLLRDSEGHLRYSRKIFVLDNGRPAPGSSFSEGVHQCLCAKENIALRKLSDNNRDAFIILPENQTQRSSFSVTFIAGYTEGNIYGVSGTTRSAAALAEPEINYEQYSYLTVPREKPLIREDKKVWLAKDEAQQIQFLRRAIMNKPGCPVLLICKDDQQSLRLYNAFQQDPLLRRSLSRVHGLTAPEDERQAIQQAGRSDYLTISTAGMMGRGVDIHADNLLVLAAYVPTEEDEIQIKGRSARIGKPGEYRMIPAMSCPDNPLQGSTYNVHHEVLKSQKQRQCLEVFQKEATALYAFLLEDITQHFLADLERCEPETRLDKLQDWQRFLGEMQKGWEPQRKQLLEAIHANDAQKFSAVFTQFAKKCVDARPGASIDTDRTSQITKTYAAIRAAQGFFVPQRPALQVQPVYDPADDGQACVYEHLFAQTRATLRGERRLFANIHAWREGRGVLFPDLMAVLHGERQLFANLVATIFRWIAAVRAWLHAKQDFAPDMPSHLVPVR